MLLIPARCAARPLSVKSSLGGCDLNTPEGQAMFKDQNLRFRCQEFTGKAAELAARILVGSTG